MAGKANLGLVIVVVLGVLTLCSSAWAVDGPIAHWKLDGDANDSAGTNHGTIYGATPTTGQINGALDFDGVDDYVDCGDSASINNLSTFSVSLWFKADTISTQVQYPHLICQKNLPDYGWTLLLHGGYSRQVASRLMTSGVPALSTTNFVPDVDQWYHAVMTYDDTGDREIHIYIDGIECSYFEHDAATGTMRFHPSIKTIIGNRAGGDWGWDGLLDEVAIYDRALSSEEIQELYQAGLAELAFLEIVGPDQVAEDSQAQYKAIAVYDNDSTKDVTALADWSIEPNDIADVNAGVLTTEPIDVPEDIIITAAYTNGTTVEAGKEVSIFAICPSGSALNFDGVDDYVDCGNGPAITGTGAFTASAWINTDSVRDQAILTQKSIASSNGMYGFGIMNRRIQFQIYNNGYSYRFQSNVTVNDGLWHHIVVVRTNSTDGEIYVDGSLVGTGSGPAKSLSDFPV